MHLSALFLLPLIAAAPFYELHGHLPSIGGSNLSVTAYETYDETLKQHLAGLLSSKLISSVISVIQIHGKEANRPTAIFYAYIETNGKVEASELQKSNDLELFYFGERDEKSIGTTGSDWADTIKQKRAEQIAINAAVVCVNGGLALPNSTCACPSFYTGLTCQLPTCLNGGIIDGNRCACPPGHYSVNCEPRGCLPPVQDKFDNSKQTFILILNQRSSMAYVLNNVIVGLPGVLTSIDNANQILLDNYILVNYVYTTAQSYYMNQKSFQNRNDFVSYVQGVTAIDGAAKQYTNWALYASQIFDPYMHGFSNIFIFSDATDINGGAPQFQVSTKGDEIRAITQTIAWRNRPVYLLSQMKGQPIPTNGSDYDAYRRVAAATLGDIISFDMLEVSDILNKVIPSYLQNENIVVTYQSTVTNLAVPPGDTPNITILVTVDPNYTVPGVSHSAGQTTISSGSRYLLLSAPSNFGLLSVTSLTPYSVRVWVNSGNTALLGYSTDPYIDIGSSFILAEVAPYVSAAPIGWTGSVSYALVDNLGSINVPLANSTARSRASIGECSFPLTFGQFTTSLPPKNQMVHLAMNNSIRIVPGFSGQLDHHTATDFTCYNNGTRTGPSSCQCDNKFHGTNCATPMCYYGGKVNPFPGNGSPLCLCPPGYSGDHCDQLQCPIVPGPQYPFTSQRSLAVVIQNSMSQAWLNANMYKGMTNMLASMTGFDKFAEYLSTTFNNIMKNGQPYTQILSSSTTDQSDFLYGLESDNLQYMASSATTQDALGALYKTIYLLDNDKSSIFIFIDAAPMTTFTEYDIIDYAVARQFEINLVITPPYGMKELCISGGNASIYREIAQKTGGVILNLCNNYGNYSNDPVLQFLTAYGPSHHHTENLNEALSAGANSVSIDFIVDNPQDEVYAFVNCDNVESFNVTLTNKDNGNTDVLAPLASMPFVGTYRITAAYDNTQGQGSFPSISIQCRYKLSTTTSGGSCSIRASEKTLNALYLAFAGNPAIDWQSSSLLYGVPTSPVAHPFAGSYLINASSISLNVSTDDGTILYNHSAVKRQICQFDYYFIVPFVCQQSNQTFVFTSTVTTYAGTFQRTQRGFCYHKQELCLNGGTYDMVNMQCDCLNDWNGDFCEEPRCQNGGTITDFACSCPIGFTGQFCQYGSCLQWNFMETNDVRQTDFKQLTFVLDRNQPQLLVNVMLDNMLRRIVQNTESPITPTQYSLIHFDENGVYNIISTTHQQKFLDTFHNSINQVTRTNPTATAAMAALYEAYKLNIQPPNIIYVITGADSLLTNGNLKAVLRQKLGTQINLIYTPAGTTYPGQPTQNLGYVARTARQTGGRVLPVTVQNFANLSDVLVSTTKEDAFIADDGARDCSAGISFSFLVESTFTRLVIETTGNDVSNNGNVKIWDAAGTLLTVNYMFSDNAAYIVNIVNSSNVQGGMWTANVKTSSGPCFIQVRAQSPIRVIPGFTSSATADYVKDGPFTPYGTNSTTYMTFRVIDTGNQDMSTSLTTLSIFHTQYYQSWGPDDSKHTLDVAITPRDPTNCASQFMATWQMENYGYQKFIVTGTDLNHVEFQRTFYFNLPSTSDNSSTCAHGTRNAFGECICAAQYTGTYCNERICQNGGTSSYGVCACVNGYYNDFCTQYIIDAANTTTATPF